MGLAAWRSRGSYGAPSTGEEGDRSGFSLDESYATGIDIFGSKAEYYLPNASITSNTSYLDFANASKLDLGSFGLAAPTLFTNLDAHAFTQEVNLGSEERNAYGGGPQVPSIETRRRICFSRESSRRRRALRLLV